MTDACFPITDTLGELSLNEVLLEYDGPRLFSCRNRTTGDQYLAVWVGEVEGQESWLLTRSNNRAINKVRDGDWEVRAPFVHASSGSVYKLSLVGPSSASVEELPAAAVPEELLPAAGERLQATNTASSHAETGSISLPLILALGIGGTLVLASRSGAFSRIATLLTGVGFGIGAGVLIASVARKETRTRILQNAKAAFDQIKDHSNRSRYTGSDRSQTTDSRQAPLAFSR